MASVNDFLKEWESESEYIIAHTSGSTGTPKEIKLPKRDMTLSARATNLRFGIDSNSRLGCPLSVDYIAGKMMYVRALEAKCEIIEMPVSNEVVIDRTFDLLAVVPSQVENILQQKNANNRIRNLIIGGAALNDRLAAELYAKGVNAFATYGMTETCSHVALAPITGGELIFEAMPGIWFETDSRGCLVINAPSYSFKKLVTNDIADLINDRKFRLVGRYDNVINSGGIKISPELLEKEISKWIDVPFYVTGIADSKWGEIPVIVYEGSKNLSAGIIETLRANLDHRRCPKKAIATDTLPRTPNGKIKRTKIE